MSIPAEVRHRWKTSRIVLEDQGNAVLIRPIPADPIGAAAGSLSRGAHTSDELRAISRAEEAEIEDRRLRGH